MSGPNTYRTTADVDAISDADALTGAMLIGANRVHGDGGTVRGVDPRTGEQLEPAFGLGTRSHAEQASVLAAEAFPAYRETTPTTRANFLETIAVNIDAIAEPLVARVIRETGIAETRVRGELARTTNQLRLFATAVRDGDSFGAVIDTALPDRAPLPRPDIRQRKVPVGPVAVFGASNFPLAFSVAGGDTASALAAGCPVVVKAHSAHPGTSELVGTGIQQAVAQHGLPEGVFSMLFGDGREVGTALVSDPRIRAVGFTGSRNGGTALLRAATQRPVPIPVYAEMSSVNPVFLLPDALRCQGEQLGKQFVGSLTTGAGQLCTNPGLVFGVDGPELDTFIESAATAVSSAAAQPMLNSDIYGSYMTGVSRLAQLQRVTEVATGASDGDIPTPGQARLFSTDADAFIADPAMHEEVFGAASLVVRLKSLEQAESILTALEGQLTATVHATERDYAFADELLRSLEHKVGRIVFNGWPTGVEVGHAMVHGGPYPATTDSRSTSVGTRAIDRFLRPVAYQNVPTPLLPTPVDAENSLGLHRQVDGKFTND